jgi:hypothetical protein
MLNIQIGSMDSSVIEPPHGSLYTLIRLSTVASAIITAASTIIRVFEFFIFFVLSFLRGKIKIPFFIAKGDTKSVYPYGGIIRIRLQVEAYFRFLSAEYHQLPFCEFHYSTIRTVCQQFFSKNYYVTSVNLAVVGKVVLLTGSARRSVSV